MRGVALGLAIGLTAAPALAMQEPQCGRAATPPAPDPRTCSFLYEPGQVYHVEATLMGVVRVEFDPDEDASTGGGVNPDPKGFDVTGVKNILIIKPKEADRIGRSIVVPVFTIDSRGERRSYDFQIDVRPVELDGKTGMVRAAFTYPGRAEQRAREARAKLIAQQQEKARQARAGLEEQQMAARLAVAHFYGHRHRAYSVQVEDSSPGGELFRQMDAAGFRISDNGQITTFEMPPGVPGVSLFSVDIDGTKTMAPPIPKTGGTVVVPRIARLWRVVRGDAVFCLIYEGPVRPYDAGTGTIDPGVTIMPRARTASAP